jgi:hypothetical protein
MTATPPMVDRETWQKQIDTRRVREKAHTREGTRLPRLAGGCRWSSPKFKSSVDRENQPNGPMEIQSSRLATTTNTIIADWPRL